MLVQCPSCATTYDLPEASIGQQGRKVRCAACKTTWHVVAPPEDTVTHDTGTYDTGTHQTDIHGAEPQLERAQEMRRFEPAAPEPVAAPPVPESLSQRFAADDLRLAGLDPASRPGEAQLDPLEDGAPTTIVAARLKPEATLDDDVALVAEPQNGQDDIDALFASGGAEPEPAAMDDVDATQPGDGRALDHAEAPDDPEGLGPVGKAQGTSRFSAARDRAAAARPRQRMGNSKAAKPKRRISYSGLAAILVFGLLGSAVLRRNAVVAAVPQSAGLFAKLGLPVNLRGVEIRDVSSRIVVDQGVRQLVVEGEIGNVERQEVKLSRLRFAVRDENGREIYSWKAAVDKPVIEAGENLRFRRRLASPPDGAADVQVRFETPGDKVAGVQ